MNFDSNAFAASNLFPHARADVDMYDNYYNLCDFGQPSDRLDPDLTDDANDDTPYDIPFDHIDSLSSSIAHSLHPQPLGSLDSPFTPDPDRNIQSRDMSDQVCIQPSPEFQIAPSCSKAISFRRKGSKKTALLVNRASSSDAALRSNQSALDSYFSECYQRYGSKTDKSRQRQIQSLSRKLAAFTEVWEFGQRLDFSNQRDQNNYLAYVSDWLARIVFPNEVSKLVKFTKEHAMHKPHRVLAWRILSLCGSPHAACLWRALRQKLHQKHIDALVQAQSSGEDGFMTYLIFFLTAISRSIKGKTTDAWKAVKKALSPKKVSEAANDLLAGLGNLAEKASEAAETMMKWIKKTCKGMLGYFTDLSFLLKPLIKYFLMCLVSIAAAASLFVLVPTVAIHAATLMFQKLKFRNSDTILTPLSESMVPHAQASGSTFGSSIANFLSDNLKVDRREFMFALGVIPRFHSLGKAIEWFLEKGHTIVSRCIEYWTGVPRPTSDLEREIQNFSETLELLRVAVSSNDIKIMLSPETERLVMDLKSMKDMIEKQMTNLPVRRAVRPYYVSRMTQGVISLGNMTVTLADTKRSSRPRPVPVWLYLSGQPGVGKSTIQKQIIWDIWALLRKERPGLLPDRDLLPCDSFIVNQGEEYFDAYSKQFFCLIDDLFQTKSPDERRSTALMLISAVSSAPYALRVADLNNKNAIFFESPCIISSTNLEVNADFAAENLGLVDPSALTTRRTIAVTMHGFDHFVLSKDAHLTLKGSPTGKLTYMELVRLVVECIKQRLDDMAKPVQTTPVPSFNFTYQGGRITVNRSKDNEAQMKTGSLTSEVRDVMEERYQFLARAEKRSELQEEELLMLKRQLSGKDKLPDEEIVVEEVEEECSTPHASFFKESFTLPDDYLTKFDSETALEIWHCKTNPPASHRWNTSPHPVQSRKGETYYPIYLGKGRFVFVETSIQWKHIIEALDQDVICSSTAFGETFHDNYVLHTSRTHPFYKVFMWMPMWMLKKIFWLCPEYFFSKYTFDDVPHLNHFTWRQVRDRWFANQGNTEKEKIKFHKLFKSWKQYPKTQEAFNKFFEKVCSRPSTTAVVSMTLAASGVVLASLGVALKFFCPAVYVEAQHYPSGKKLQKVEIRRTSGRRVQSLAQLKQRDRAANRQAQMRAAEDPFLYRAIDRNSEIIEMRCLPKGSSVEEQDSVEPLASCFVLFFSGRRALVPLHTILSRAIIDDDHDVFIDLVRSGKHRWNINDLTIIEEIRGDVGVVEFPGIAERPTIIQHFSESFPIHGAIERVLPHVEKSGYGHRATNMFDNSMLTIRIGDYEPFNTDLRAHNMPNYRGLCGVPYLCHSGSKIFAIHMAGSPSTNVSYGVTIFKSDLEMYATGPVITPPITIDLQEAQAMPGALVLGKSEPKYGVFQQTTTSIVPSSLNLQGCPFPVTDSAPAMLVKTGDVSPYVNSLTKIGQQRYPGKPSLVDFDLTTFLPTTFNKNNAKMLSIWQAIYGIEGYLSSLDLDASPGYFYKKLGLSRRQLFYDDDGNPRIHPILLANLLFKLRRIDDGVMIVPVLEDMLKDELRDKARVDAGKTRLFSSGDLDFLIIQRMFLARLFLEIESDPVGSPCGLGINPHSHQWGDLYSRILGDPRENRSLNVGDFGSYDFSVKNEPAQQFEQLCVEATKGTDIKESSLRLVIRGSFLGYHCLGTLWYLRPWGTNSGLFITSVFNSFANWWLHKQAFLNLYPGDSFEKLIQCSFTGDDSLVSVPESHSQYNMSYLSVYFQKVWAMEYTSCFKDQRSTVSFDEANYLKRRFKPSYFGIMAPLDERSMYDMVAWTTTKSNHAIMQSTLDSFMLEAFHYGKDKYDECRSWVQSQREIFKVLTYSDMERMRRSDYR